MPHASTPDKIYLYLYFTLIFLYFFNLHFPTTELSTPYSFVVPPPGHLSLGSEGGQAKIYLWLILISPVSWSCGGSAAAGPVGPALGPPLGQPGRAQPSSSLQPCTCENCATETSCPLCFCESAERGLVPEAVHRRGKGERGVPAGNLSHFTAAM